MAEAAAAEQREIDAMLAGAVDTSANAAEALDATPTDPEPAVQAAATEPAPAPAAAPPAVNVDLLQRQYDSMMGRMEALNRENRENLGRLAAVDANRQFLEQRASEQQQELQTLRERLRSIEAAQEVTDVVKGFSSDLVDAQQFAEIVKGLNPALKRRDEMIQGALAKQAELERKLDEVLGTAREEIKKVDQRWLDRNLLHKSPDIKGMLQSPSGKEFLAQRVPGGRRTRLQELQDAYAEGDEDFIAGLVSQWSASSKPAAPTPDPAPAIESQVPRAPKPVAAPTDDELQAAFQKVLRGEMTRAQFKELQGR
jgi:hypothetical protein